MNLIIRKYMKIDTVKIEKIEFGKGGSAAKVAELKVEVADLLPKISSYRVSFVMNECPIALANSIRRCLIEYIPINVLDFDMYNDFDCDDPYLTCDYFHLRLAAVAIDQDKNYKGSLQLTNNSSTELLNIYTSDFKFDGAAIPSKFPIGRLRPKKSIKIKNIQMKTKRGYEDGKAKGINGLPIYEILDVEPFNQFTGTGESSLIKTPTKFRLGYETRRNSCSPTWPLQEVCGYIENLCDVARKSIEEKDFTQVQYSFQNNVHTYVFMSGYMVVPDLLRDYLFELVEDITFNISANNSFEEEIGILKYTYNDDKAIFTAFENIKKDINKIRKEVCKK
jgi:hypothetical protein